jgi:CHAT domain-containing protein
MKKTFLFFILFISLINPILYSSNYGIIPNDTSQHQADSIMKSIHYQAFKEVDLGNYEHAEKLYRNVIRLKKTYAPLDTTKLANIYINYANILKLIWQYDESLLYFEKAIELADKNSETSYLSVIIAKGYLLLRINDAASALDFFEQAERNLKKIKSPNSENIKDIYYGKVAAYNMLNRIPEACQNIEIIKSFPGVSKRENFELDLEKFTLLYVSKENQKADELYKRLIHSDLPNDLRINLMLEYGSYQYINHSKIDDAINIYKNLENILNKSSLTRTDILQVYNNLGNCYETKKMYEETLDTYQKALICLYPGFSNSDIKFDPPLVSVYEEAQNVILFSNKAEVLYKYSSAIGDTSYLSPSLNNCMRCVNTMQKMRFRISSDKSQFLISKNQRSTFNLAQLIALENYKVTNNNKFLNTAFIINEEGRAFTLLSAIRNQKAMNFGNISEKLKKQERDLNWQLSLYDELIYKEKLMAEPDKVKISTWEDMLFKANSEYSSLLIKLEREYPEYYRLKYDEKVTDLFEVQKKIDKNTVLVEYSYMDSVLVIYTASRQKIGATKVNLNPGFEDKCIEFLNLITTQDFSKNVTTTYNSYAKLANELYSILIEPVKDQLDGENLIIIPDGAISYLPFDALVTAKVPEGPPKYRTLPYLLRDYSVGYSYSTTIHFNPLQHVRIPSESILAFAPVYTEAGNDSSENTFLRNQKFLDLVVLPGVTIEVNNISKILKTDAFYNVSAKESVFKDMAGRYKILHLAMHTMIDNTDPMLSRLVFTQVPDGEEDGLLHTYEIYNMKLNANLTVLSSCSSGYGKIQPGEGVQSLARGFAYAGCPSILMTLWEVGDLSTVLVMTDFYKFLKEHKTKPQAIRESKLNFLSEADELRSNPFYWASYVIIGDSSPIYPLRAGITALSAFLLLLPVGFLGISYRKYKKAEEKEKRNAA